MRQDLDEALVKDFPNLYRQRFQDMRTTCMMWGFECGDGWEPLIRILSEKLEKLICEIPDIEEYETIDCSGEYWDDAIRAKIAAREPSYNPETQTYINTYNKRHYFSASQVKEKYGTLRFYMSGETDAMSEAINEAEDESAKTCENCGGPGKVYDGGWVVTRCDPCYDLYCHSY